MTSAQIATVVLAFVLAVSPAFAQGPADSASAADIVGKAERRVAKNPDRWTALKIGDAIAADSAVQTAEGSAILLSIPGGHVMRIGENTSLEIKNIGQDRSYAFALLRGRIWSFVNKATKPARYEVETGSVILGVSGTLFSVARDDRDGELDASVEDGQVRLRRGRVEKTLERGFQLRVWNSRLAFAPLHKQTRATQAMWKTVGSAESWTKPNGALRLNKQVEERARAVKQERAREKGGGHAGGHKRKN